MHLVQNLLDNTRGYLTMCVELFQASRSRENMRAMSKMSQNRAILYASDGFEIPKHFSGIAIVFSPDSHHLWYKCFSKFFHFRETRL